MEQGFKITKRAGWQGHKTRRSDPGRAERLWLAVSVATLGRLRIGGEAEASILESTIAEVGAILRQEPRQRKATQSEDLLRNRPL